MIDPKDLPIYLKEWQLWKMNNGGRPVRYVAVYSKYLDYYMHLPEVARRLDV
jgi:hypothetical protein